MKNHGEYDSVIADKKQSYCGARHSRTGGQSSAIHRIMLHAAVQLSPRGPDNITAYEWWQYTISPLIHDFCNCIWLWQHYSIHRNLTNIKTITVISDFLLLYRKSWWLILGVGITKKRQAGHSLESVKGLYWSSSSALNLIFHVITGICSFRMVKERYC